MAVREGGCLCGAVRFELEGDVPPPTCCHCRFCRRAHGAPFVATVLVPTGRLRFVAGEDEIARYEGRFFCRRCATRLFNRAEGHPEATSLVVTSLDVEPDAAPVAHMNLESKAPWYTVRDGAVRYDRFPPGVEEALRAPEREGAQEADSRR